MLIKKSQGASCFLSSIGSSCEDWLFLSRKSLNQSLQAILSRILKRILRSMISPLLRPGPYPQKTLQMARPAKDLPGYLLGRQARWAPTPAESFEMVCMTSCPVIVNAGCSARPALHARTRASSCVARSSSEYPSSSWPRGRVDTSTCVQAHALASTVARETEAPTEHALSDAELIERRRLLEGSYLAETAPEPASVVCLRADCASL